MTATTVQQLLDTHNHWPCKLELATGSACVWKQVGGLRALLAGSAVPQLLEMTADDLLIVVMEPETFGPDLVLPISERLARLADLAEVDPRSAVLCLLAAEEVASVGKCLAIDVPSEEVGRG